MRLIGLFTLVLALSGCHSPTESDCKQVKTAVVNDAGDTVAIGTLYLCGGSTLAP